MTMRVWCARCGRSYEVPRALAGRRIRCRSCGHIQRVPEPSGTSLSEAPAPVVPTPGTTDATTYALIPDPPPPSTPPTVPKPSPGPRPRPSSTPSWRSQLADLTSRPGHLQEWSLALIALSAADLFVTYALLRASPHFYESNPVAMWFFRRWNIAGMTGLKFGAIAIAIAIGELVERQRPGWGKAVLLISCLATTAVVVHGLRLYLGR